MCTAISYHSQSHYFGRTLDLEFSYGEQVVITPRNRVFLLKNGSVFRTAYAMIGMATVMEDYPLYYEAANEAGLAAAGLNFVGNAVYQAPKEGMENITPFELIPWMLGQATTVQEVRSLFANLNLSNQPFSAQVPLAQLHFMFSDRRESLVVEATADGIHLYDNPYHVMTNNPPFAYHRWNMNNYLNLSPRNGENQFSQAYPLSNYGVGMGALGLPGDVSSSSRFVRAAFHLTNAVKEETEVGCVTQFFHIMDSVSMMKGSTLTQQGACDITQYTSCINTEQGIYYYKTYGNNQITAISLHEVDLNGKQLIVFPLRKEQSIYYEHSTGSGMDA